ncbi:MAG: hypothetical protein HY820_31965 [Acidobacteria bacterium]|nr:hypothetical protein [Acidobacteriota bacterium]
MALPISPDILAVALVGLEAQKVRIDEHIAAVRAQLGKRGLGRPAAAATAASSATPAPKPKRRKLKLSAEGRANIVAALKKRWAEKEAATTAKRTPGTPAKRGYEKSSRALSVVTSP